jgi:hypothetical protein
MTSFKEFERYVRNPRNLDASELEASQKEEREEAPTKAVSDADFTAWLDEVVEKEFGSWEQIDKDKDVLKGNRALSADLVGADTYQFTRKSVERAQYGRVKYSFVRQALEAVHLGEGDTLVDIGSGIGTVVLQAAATFGCRALGIELMIPRHQVALRLLPHFEAYAQKHSADWAARVRFLQGDFRVPEHFKECRKASVLFVNNAETVFQARSVVAGAQTLDWHVARLFGGMEKGSRIICIEPLIDLETQNLAPCFERREYMSEGGATSWTMTKRTRFVTYLKQLDQWTCVRCQAVNDILSQSSDEWGETFCDTCLNCGSGSKRVMRRRN